MVMITTLLHVMDSHGCMCCDLVPMRDMGMCSSTQDNADIREHRYAKQFHAMTADVHQSSASWIHDRRKDRQPASGSNSTN